eukprot:TRINITY_DN40689_c0_g1_i1.p1 TRINITY_DN40689_c0_g1~~TRINITY_DN40689_c0_g1_i1.p1  ORF type:complete len:123 (+),score=11.79 TRINITY_DN40689_c0_g1_i1:67-435(+)
MLCEMLQGLSIRHSMRLSDCPLRNISRSLALKCSGRGKKESVAMRVSCKPQPLTPLAEASVQFQNIGSSTDSAKRKESRSFPDAQPARTETNAGPDPVSQSVRPCTERCRVQQNLVSLVQER